MKVCRHCARPLKDKDRYCPICGEAVNVPEEPPIIYEFPAKKEQNEATASAGEQVAPAQKKGTNTLLIVVAVLLFLVAAVSALWYFGGFGEDDESSETKSDSFVRENDPEDDFFDTHLLPTTMETPQTTAEATTRATITTRTTKKTTRTTKTTIRTTTTTKPITIPGDASGVEVVPKGELHAGVAYRVKADGGLFMRSGPSQSYRDLQNIPDRSTVTVYYTQGEWWYGSYDGLVGWMHSGYLFREDEYVEEEPTIREEYRYLRRYRVVSDNGVNMRSGPGLEYRVLSSVPYYKIIAVSKRNGDWVYGCWKDGGDRHYGWVRMDNLVIIT